ncbi:MAG: hypothetical protein JW820_01620 [Spirochaetales bacterium]|nr:hypothetical protein [Spirochaetales bacterium]
MPFVDATRTAARGLWRGIRGALLAVGILVTIGLLGLALALPLWAFASLEPRAYTWFALALLGGGLGFLIVRGVARASRRDGGFAPWVRLRVLPRVKKAGLVLGFGAAAYAVALLLVRGLVAAGVLTAAGAAALGMWLRFASRKGSERR